MKIDFLEQFRPKPGSLLPRIFKNFSLSFVGSLFLLAIGLVRTSLLIKAYPITAYGNILIVLTLFNFLNTFFGVRVNDLLYKLYPKLTESDDRAGLRGLLIFSLLLNGTIALLMSGTVFLAADWIAVRFYENGALATAFRVYAFAAFLNSATTGIYTAILRLHDRFAWLIVPEIIGGATTLGIVVVYLQFSAERAILPIVFAFAIGTIVAIIPPLISALRTVWPILRHTTGNLRTFWHTYRPELVATLFQTNLVGYLKIAANDGGFFLLGVLASPVQVALFGTAQQLTRPLTILQNNINTAIVPELVNLAGKGNLFRLYRFALRFSRYASIVGAVAFVGAWAVSRPLLLLFAKAEYLDALPIFYIILATFFLTFISLPYYSIALSLGKLGRRNLIVALRLIYLVIAIVVGLSAFNLALVQLAGVLSLRLLFDIPLLRQLKRTTQSL